MMPSIAEGSTTTALPTGNDWGEGDETDVSLIEDCYCPNCGGGQATTTMLPTRIPMFREIIVMSLCCEDCTYRNSEVSFGGEIQMKGRCITLRCASPSDLDRQIIKSDSATLSIPSLQFEIPPTTQRGTVSTLEGVLRRAAETLDAGQPERLKLGDVENFYRCREVIETLRGMADGDGDSGDEDGGGEDAALDASKTADAAKVFEPFDVVLDDPAGNSFIESNGSSDSAPLAKDPNLVQESYFRTATQDMALGLQPSKEAVEAGFIDDANPAHKNLANAPSGRHVVDVDNDATVGGRRSKGSEADVASNAAAPAAVDDGDRAEHPRADEIGNEALTPVGIGRQEVMKFPTSCPNCHQNTETSMCITDVPHFKECIIMSLVCDHCGYKSNEIKGGGGIPKYGTRITLTVRDGKDDMAREVLKSDTAGVAIPELELELEEGGLDGMYTTVEGLVNKLHERLKMANPFGHGDSATKQHATNDPAVSPGFGEVREDHAKYADFLRRLRDLADGERLPFTLVISDPLSNSFVGPVPRDAVALAERSEKEGSRECYQAYVDEGMNIEEYERTQNQNDTLGLTDMKVENYQMEREGTEAHLHPTVRESAAVNYGTNRMVDLPDRLRRLDHRGADHPHMVAKAPVRGDNTVMGPGSAHFAVPAMEQRGRPAVGGHSVGKNDAKSIIRATSEGGNSDTDRDVHTAVKANAHDLS